MASNLPLILEVALVGHDNDGKVVLVFDPENLLVECRDLIEAVARGDAVHEEEALARAHILFSHRSVALGRSPRSASIQHLTSASSTL